ncbi:hypothetical protein FSP39_004487 [Pinctada imbricata]|uniref:Uncharacterized protein n=1 Tax=Pinctada imbricata TaxID=66713 RepID=A0AA88YLQ6_PINIB|nr:hypothetical protein FSP39_004487 [Pinctada imbricata]
MILLRFEVLLLFALSVSVLGQNYIPQTCNILTVAPCICQDERGNFVDIRSIASIDLQPAFKDNPTPGNDANLYSWNPCYGFEEGADNSSCITDKDTAACKVSENRTTFENIGTQHSASFGHYDNGNLSLIYHSWDNKRYSNYSSRDSIHTCTMTIMAKFIFLCCPGRFSLIR